MERRSFFGRMAAFMGGFIAAFIPTKTDGNSSEVQDREPAILDANPQWSYLKSRTCPRCGCIANTREFIFSKRGRLCPECNIWWVVPNPIVVDWNKENMKHKNRELRMTPDGIEYWYSEKMNNP